ncbi:MAG: AAA family ATPase [Caldilineaceae bacterium]|nr:AAA family ATPase [Caldilineaceae bacterium]
MSRITFYFFGGFHAETSANKAIDLPTDKVRALLAYLLLQPDQPHRREQLAALLWPEGEGSTSLRNLRQSLYRLNKALDAAAPGLFSKLCSVTRRDVTLHGGLVRTDTADFWTGVSLPAQHQHNSLAECTTCREAVAAAVELYRGELLAGLTLSDAPDFEAWLTGQRQQHHLTLLSALAALADCALTDRDFVGAHAYAQRQLDLEPWLEVAHRQAMRGLVGMGQRTAAMEQFHRCRTALAEELGVDPEPETVALYQELLEPAAVSLPASISAPLPTPRLPATNLPALLSSFVGRQNEMEAIHQLLQDNRLLTLTGPGGSGKTRLAVESGQRLLAVYPHGVWLVELADLTDPARVIHAIAHSLGVGEREGQPLRRLVTDFLAARGLLLIVDNCEHLLNACAANAEFILAHCPGVRILATSREPLGIFGEQLYAVPPLPFPAFTRLGAMPQDAVPQDAAPQDVHTLMDVAAVRLFVERAAAHRPGFALSGENAESIVQICQRLDGMPLALELAAARVRALSPARIAALLDERFSLLTSGSRTALPRQQTLRALIDWSYDLLSPAEQRLFRRLAVFAGGALMSGVEAVCADPGARSAVATIDGEPVFELLLRLVDKSLLFARDEAAETRYGMLETIRAYALERLVDAGEADAMALRHARHYTDLAAVAEMELVGGEEFTWLQRLGREDENLRSALQWAFGDAQNTPWLRGQLGLHLTGCLAYYWDATSQLDESRRWLNLAWARVDKRTSPPEQARLASGLGTLAWRRGHYAEARSLHQQALQFYQQAEDDWGIAFALHNVAVQYDCVGEWVRGRELLQESIRVAEAGDQPGMLAMALSSLGNHYVSLGEYAEAGPLLEQAVALIRPRGSLRLLGYSLTALLEYQLATGRFRLGWATVDELEAVATSSEDRALLVAAWVSRARMLHFDGDHRSAFDACAAALSLYRSVPLDVYQLEVFEPFAVSLIGIGRADAGLLLLAVCENHRLISQKRRPPAYEPEIDDALAAARSLLSPGEFAAIQAQAETLTIPQVLDFALALADGADAPLPPVGGNAWDSANAQSVESV